jgi:hypothetical protein
MAAHTSLLRFSDRSSSSLRRDPPWFEVEKQNDDNGTCGNVKPHDGMDPAHNRVGFDDTRRSVEYYAGKNDRIKCDGIGELGPFFPADGRGRVPVSQEVSACHLMMRTALENKYEGRDPRALPVAHQRSIVQ